MPLVPGLPRIVAVAALGLALLAAPGLAQSPAASPAPDASPLPSPAASPGLSPALGSIPTLILEDLLLAREPTTLTNCQSVRQPVFVGELAAIACPVGSKGEGLIVRLLDSPATMAGIFADYVGLKAGKRGACAKRVALEPRIESGQKVGQLACYDAPDGTRVFIWTDERYSTLSWFAAKQTRPFKQLYKLYASVGPFAIPDVSPSPAP